MKTLLALCLLLPTVACGRIGVQDSTHEVKVSGGTENVIRLEIGSCDSIKNESRKVECINAMIDLMAMFAEAQQEGEN